MTRFPHHATSIHPLHYAKAWYFVSFAGYACMTPYLPLFYEKWGLTTSEIGLVNALRPLVSFVATPVWGVVADYTGKHNLLFFWKTVSQGVGYTSLGWLVPKYFTSVFVYIFFLEATCAATMTLADAATGTMTRRAASRNEKPLGGTSYGEIRLWGAVSWGFIFGPAMGAALTYLPAKYAQHAPFIAYPIFLAMSAVTTTGFDFTPFEETSEHERNEHERNRVDDRNSFDDSDEDELMTTAILTAPGTGSKSKPGVEVLTQAAQENSHTSTESVATKTWRVVSNYTNAATFFAFLLMSASMAVTDTYLFLWMEDPSIGASRLCMGVALGFTCVSEVIVFKKEKKIKKYISTELAIVLILFCYALRQWFYAALPWLSVVTPLGAWIVLPAQLLHGITFGLFWSVGTAFVQQISPPGLTSSVMGVFGGMNAAGSFLGSVLGGFVFRRFGGGGLFGGIGALNFVLGIVAYLGLLSNLGGGLRRVGSLRDLGEQLRRNNSFAKLISFRSDTTISHSNTTWHAVRTAESCEQHDTEMAHVRNAGT